MTVLSAQTIRWYCSNTERPLISPFVERGVVRGRSYGLSACTYDCRTDRPLVVPVRQSRLAVTLERFIIPSHICASVLDKSSWARVFLSAFNTHLDPGWSGYLTVELANLSEEPVEFEEGDPLCQIKFEFLDQSTEMPYRGKYNNQPAEPVPARREE